MFHHIFQILRILLYLFLRPLALGDLFFKLNIGVRQAAAHAVIGVRKQLEFIVGLQLHLLRLGGLGVLHSIGQRFQRIEDDLAKLRPEQGDHPENDNRRYHQGKPEDGSLGLDDGGVPAD